MNKFGEKLKEVRINKGFPQKMVADYLNLHRSNYSKIENNVQKMTTNQLKLFCELCDVSADYLLNIKTGNKKTLSKTTIDEINSKMEYIKSAINE